MKRESVGGRRGFTLVEVLVTMLLIGIFAGIALPAYLRSVEGTKAQTAISVIEMAGAANQMFALDHNNYWAVGTITNACNAAVCVGSMTADAPACDLVACKYLAAQNFDQLAYTVSPDNAAVGSGAICPCSSTLYGGTYQSTCGRRKTSGSQGTGISPYKNWGYGVNAAGKLVAIGGAPLP